MIKAQALKTNEKDSSYRKYQQSNLGTDRDSYMTGWNDAVEYVYRNLNGGLVFADTSELVKIERRKSILRLRKHVNKLFKHGKSVSAKKRGRIFNQALDELFCAYARPREN